MNVLLFQHGCAVALEGEAKLPKDMAAERKVDIRERAHNAILLSLTEKVLREVMDQMSAFGLWEKLCGKYQNNSLMNRLYQKQRWYTLRISESTQVMDHLDNFNRTILDLQGVNVKIEDKDQALIFLCSLLNSYKNFVDTMLYGKITITVNDVKDS